MRAVTFFSVFFTALTASTDAAGIDAACAQSLANLGATISDSKETLTSFGSSQSSVKLATTTYTAADTGFTRLKEGESFTPAQKQAFIKFQGTAKSVNDGSVRALKSISSDAGSDVLEDLSIVQFNTQSVQKDCNKFLV